MAAAHRVIRAKTSWRRTLSRLGPLLVVAGLAGVGLSPARGWLTSHVLGLEHRADQDMHQSYVPVHPIGARASSQAPGHGPGLAIDGGPQTYWLTGGRDGVGARLVIRFASPQNIDDIGLLSGESGSYLAQGRPETLEITAPGNPAAVLSFIDSADFQHQAVRLHDVTTVTVTIKAAYRGQHGDAVAVREIEFFNRV